VIVAQTIKEVSYKQTNRVSSAPQEQGAFLSYNKVADPFEGSITFLQGGQQIDRSTLLEDAEDVVASLDLYNLVMPEIVYSSINIISQSFRRSSAEGTTLIALTLQLEEIRVTGVAEFTQTQQPNGASPINSGQVQAQLPGAQNPNIASSPGSQPQTVPPAGGLT
jgi:hypothetical protein